jgi:hypothetical protein
MSLSVSELLRGAFSHKASAGNDLGAEAYLRLLVERAEDALERTTSYRENAELAKRHSIALPHRSVLLQA